MRRQIRRGRFQSDDPDLAVLAQVVERGDWVLDVGANVGHYTIPLARLVGPEGRVIAFEPVSESTELLSANVAHLGSRNVTLINAAASDSAAFQRMSIPKFETGLDNYYMARISGATGDIGVLSIRVDALEIPRPVRLAKIDAEGHDHRVLKGMFGLLHRDEPILIVEDDSGPVQPFLEELGYRRYSLADSPNVWFDKGDRVGRAIAASHRP